MTVRAVEGKKPYTGGKAIEITEDKVINLLLREANNLLQVNGNNELYCDLQLDDELRPTSDFPVGVTTGRIVEDNGWDWTGTILCAKTTSGDNIKLVYTDEGEIWVDNGTGTFKKMYTASEVDDLLAQLKDYVDAKTTFKPFPSDFVTDGTTQQFLASIENADLSVGDVFLGQVSLSDMPAGISVEAEVEVYIYPSNGASNIVYCIMRSADVSPYIWRCNSYQYRGWEAIGGGGGGATYTAGDGIEISQNNVISSSAVIVDTVAPINPFTGQLWYDTTNAVLMIYDGIQWNSVGGGTPPTPPTPTCNTFTVSWTETSDPSLFNPIYSDDASGLVAGSTDFDDFFGYSAVLLDSDGTEINEVQQNAGVLDITQLGNISSGYNVMIKFPVRGIKMIKSGNDVTLSITDGIGREAEGYQYYAFQNTGDITSNMSTTVATSPLYLGTYVSSIDSTTLKSLSGKTPYGSDWSTALSYASNNGTGWTTMGYYQWNLILAYYMMKYGNPDSQTVVGKGAVNLSSSVSTGGTNSQTDATRGESTGQYSCKLFGLEDMWGNIFQRLGGINVDGNMYAYTALHDFASSVTTSSPYVSIGYCGYTGGQELEGIQGDTQTMFLPYSTTSNSSMNTYYCDSASIYSYNPLCVGGGYDQGINGGLFRTGFFDNAAFGSRIMYI